ncbi:cobalt/nickel transport system permease protein [Desulfacinum hydrothermale DSM 13146]|uniref:Cobalt/nickel transport system permease protein n=1 Tax=Desulfacinum hydrothermale DSM 13146 TaxID=1121390 RepID=A0A1W1XIV8_9BACT|nr:cobalt ECF transporter T component CbiQ [Desulfacinum hydrothermale]SMC23906.1 cobalt/nickel transport system permease protein [Desulfacinum hydrothermale DSM 13146]
MKALPLHWDPLAATGLGLAVFLTVLVAVGWFRLRKRGQGSPRREGEETERWAVPELGTHEQARGRSIFHRWDPRIKIASLVFFAFCAASVDQLGVACVCCAISCAALLTAGTPLGFAAKRIAAMAGFLAMFFVVMPLTVPVLPGDEVVQLGEAGWIQLNLRGFSVAALVAAKALSVALLMEPLFRTCTFARTVNALARMGLPESLCHMLLIMYRYVFVFRHEISRLWVGMGVRGFRPGTNRRSFHALGNFLGMLFVRSLERTERVYEAMLCRGYSGRFPVREGFHARPKDWALGACWIALSMGVLILDGWAVPVLFR